MENFIEKLKEIRSSARKMHESYLKTHGLLDEINRLVPDDFKMKEKIDVIIIGEYTKCACGKLAKPNSKWCSIPCKNRDPEIRSSIAKKNSENKVSRAAKMKQTLMEKYGVTAVQDIPEVKIKTKERNAEHHKKWIENTLQTYNVDHAQYSDFEYLKSICNKSSYGKLSRTHFNGMPPMSIYRHFERIGFDPDFDKNKSSIGELEVGDFIKSLGFDIIRNDRQLINPYELDIFIPTHNIAIEFNGLYYHNSDQNKHVFKTNLCKDKDIQLLHIFEDEWYFKQPIVESIIKTKLGIVDRIYARETSIKLCSSKQAREFLDTNHIQGFCGAEKYYGLFKDDECVSMITVGKHRFRKNETEIIRYCNKLNHVVVGGFSKLLKKIKEEYGTVYSYANYRFFDGSVYEKFGKFLGNTEPGYYWTNPTKCVRLTRYQTTKGKKLNSILGEKYNPKLTEEENMINNGYLKIWDCGNGIYLL